MTAPDELVITGIGLISAAGDSVEQSCATARAGLSGLSEHPLFEAVTRDPDWDDSDVPLAGFAPGIDPGMPGADRLLALAAAALEQGCARARLRRRHLDGALVVAASPASLGEALVKRAGIGGGVRVVDGWEGHDAMLRALAAMGPWLREATPRVAILIGVDSLVTVERMRALDEAHRLRTLLQPDGLLPGEMASALIVETRRSAMSRGVAEWCAIEAIAEGVEPQPITGELVSTGMGFTQAIRRVAAGSAHSFPWVVSDLNGEGYRHAEWGVTRARLHDLFGPDVTLQHPAEAWGDVGAATGGGLIALAAQAFRRGYAPTSRALVLAAADDGRRTAAIVRTPQPGAPREEPCLRP